jgi:hypothetical protein
MPQGAADMALRISGDGNEHEKADSSSIRPRSSFACGLRHDWPVWSGLSGQAAGGGDNQSMRKFILPAAAIAAVFLSGVFQSCKL